MSSGPMYLYHDGARISTESALGKELMKWERKPDWTPEKFPFPKMLYMAHHRKDGRRSVGEVDDNVCGGQPGNAEQWSRRCQLTVNNEAEETKAMQAGWRAHPKEALDYLEAKDAAESNQTAERHYTDARMGQVAQREAAAADVAAGLKQLPEVPVAPVRRRGRIPGSKNKPKPTEA